ncbi:MAG: hypothetical protein UU47_C0021G0009 [candidate division TM6 bacterium GW2011_GWE2_41_16]|nr:MAG: hypothetical protein UU47_C0021G0009 [candidate division TM6 bacterium GW2011_GWE2_41_16]
MPHKTTLFFIGLCITYSVCSMEQEKAPITKQRSRPLSALNRLKQEAAHKLQELNEAAPLNQHTSTSHKKLNSSHSSESLHKKTVVHKALYVQRLALMNLPELTQEQKNELKAIDYAIAKITNVHALVVQQHIPRTHSPLSEKESTQVSTPESTQTSGSISSPKTSN